MSKYANETPNTRVSDKFEYYLEDMDCTLCEHYRGKKGCGRAVCVCEPERGDAIRHGRIKRKKGWNSGWDKA
jgi:hypothetical protein